MTPDHVITYLAAQGVGAAGTVLFKELPEAPVNAIAVQQYGGAGALRTLGGSPLDRPRFQVAVRDTSRATAWASAIVIRSLLDEYVGTLSGVRYQFIELVGDLFEMAVGGELGYRVAGNYQATRART